MARSDDTERDDDEVVILRGRHAREFLGLHGGDDEDDEPEAPEGFEFDDDGYLRRKPKAKGKTPDKGRRRGFFDPLR